MRQPRALRAEVPEELSAEQEATCPSNFDATENPRFFNNIR
jgi:hypothetical protein